MRRRILIVFASVALGVMAGACGGGSKNASSDKPASNGSSGAGASAGAGASVSGAGAISSARCVAAAAAMARAAAAVPQAFTGAVDDQLVKNTEQFKAFADTAPAEIKADLKVVAAGYASFAKVLADANYNPQSGQPPSPEVIDKLQQASKELENSDFQAAAERVSTWFRDKCGR